MKLILERNDGIIVGSKEVPDNTTILDILVRSDYIATKLWSEEDIAGCLTERGYSPTQENIDAVLNTGYLRALNDCSDGDWQIIYDAITFADKTNSLRKE